MVAHELAYIRVAADAGMIYEANHKAIEAAGLSFILGTRPSGIFYIVAQWRHEHSGQEIFE
jgi:hypothetical protein